MNKNTKNFINIASPQALRNVVKGAVIYPINQATLRDKWLFGDDFKCLFLTPDYFSLFLLSEAIDYEFFYSYSPYKIKYLFFQLYYNFITGRSKGQGIFTQAVFEEDPDFPDSGFYGDHYYDDVKKALCNEDGFIQNYYLGDDVNRDFYSHSYPILPPFINEHNLGHEKYKVLAPFFFHFENKYYFMPEQNNLPENLGLTKLA